MFKTLVLLGPIHVTLFWAIVLYADRRKRSVPRLFLSKFMFTAFIVYLSHFIFYSGFKEVYSFIDPIYQVATLLVYPMYHIYFRLLTVDSKFSLKKHGVYMLFPAIIFVLYLVGSLLAGHEDFSKWILHPDIDTNNFVIKYMKALHSVISICYIIQVIFVVIANFHLVRKYGEKAIHYYSDIEDSSSKRVQMLNISLMITGVSSIVLAGLGRDFFEHENTAIFIASIIFSSMLFIIGWLGDRQKTLNPTFEDEKTSPLENKEALLPAEKVLMKKITTLFEGKKIYLNSQLNILAVASVVGSNRTYISFVINKRFGQNFCSFVNQYRIEELERKVKNQPHTNNQTLAEHSGFGSIDSMKRAILIKTGMNIKDWKTELEKDIE